MLYQAGCFDSVFCFAGELDLFLGCFLKGIVLKSPYWLHIALRPMLLVFFHLICTIDIMFFLAFQKSRGNFCKDWSDTLQGKTALPSIAWRTLGNCDAVFKPDLFTVWLVNLVGDLNAFLFWTFWFKTDVFNVSLKQCSYCIGALSVSDNQALIFSLICFV